MVEGSKDSLFVRLYGRVGKKRTVKTNRGFGMPIAKKRNPNVESIEPVNSVSFLGD